MHHNYDVSSKDALRGMEKCTRKVTDKLGLSWAKLSCQLGFGCTGINMFFLLLINMKLQALARSATLGDTS